MAPVVGVIGATGEADSGGWAGAVGAALADAFTLGAVGAVAAGTVGTLVAGAEEPAWSAGWVCGHAGAGNMIPMASNAAKSGCRWT